MVLILHLNVQFSSEFVDLRGPTEIKTLFVVYLDF